MNPEFRSGDTSDFPRPAHSDYGVLCSHTEKVLQQIHLPHLGEITRKILFDACPDRERQFFQNLMIDLFVRGQPPALVTIPLNKVLDVFGDPLDQATLARALAA